MFSSPFQRVLSEVVASFLPVWGKERGKESRERGTRQDGIGERDSIEREGKEGGERGREERRRGERRGTRQDGIGER